MAKKKSTPPVRKEAGNSTGRICFSTIDGPSIEDRLLQALHILKLCSKADPDGGSTEEFELSYPMCAAISLLESASNEIHWEQVTQAECIVKASVIALRSADKTVFGANGFDVSYPLSVAIDLIELTIRECDMDAHNTNANPQEISHG